MFVKWVKKSPTHIVFSLANVNMASIESRILNFKASKDDLESGEKFWNKAVVDMKFIVEREWITSVRKAKEKPNYGIQNMDDQLEEAVGNKLDLIGPINDSYLFELGKTLKSKLTRSKATFLVNPVSMFFPWAIFCHLLTLCRGYSCDVYTSRDDAKHVITLNEIRAYVWLEYFY